MMPGISERPEDLSARLVTELGTPTAEFACGGRRHLLFLIGMPLLFLVGLAITAAAVLMLLQRNRGGHASHKGLVLGPLLVVGSVMMAARAYRNWGLRVLTFPEGIVSLRSSQVTAVFWDDIAEVAQTRNTGHLAALLKGNQTLTVQRWNGECLRFDDYLPRLQELVSIIHRQTLGHLLPRARAAFQAGEALDFEKVAIRREGISNGKELVPWSEVKQITIDDRVLTVSRAGKWLKWLSVPSSEIPNVHVLQELVHELYRQPETASQ